MRSHGWRTTLNSIYYWLPPHVRADWFGHSESVNEAHYIAEQMDLVADGDRGARAPRTPRRDRRCTTPLLATSR